MALCRWNHSSAYIYEQDQDLIVCGEGRITVKDLKNNFDAELDKFKDYRSPLDFAIFKQYVKLWFDANTDKINHKKYNEALTNLRKFEYRRTYFNEGDLELYLQAVDSKVNANERLLDIKDKKTFIKTIDDLDTISIKVYTVTQKWEKYNVLAWDIAYYYKDKNNIDQFDSSIFYLSSFLSPELPIIEGETYLYNKKENFIINDCDKEKFPKEINNHIDKVVKVLLKHKIPELPKVVD